MYRMYRKLIKLNAIFNYQENSINKYIFFGRLNGLNFVEIKKIKIYW